ncbi:DUF4245 domain-containing protein [Rothia sp. P7181]|uniref:DUF4245 domain-containing protein n=1 Tax=Rothia sp. P7181 TaxID=3402663 RepID=UPI003ADAEA93
MSTEQHPSSQDTISTDDSSEPVVPLITQKQAQRIHAPARNMIISMAVMILILIPILWLTPALTSNKNHYNPQVDLDSIAYLSSQEAGYPVAAPEIDGWRYNFARWKSRQADGISFWNTGQLTAQAGYIELVQAQNTNPTWIAQRVNNAPVQRTQEVAGVLWDVRIYTPKDGEPTISYVGTVSGTTVILNGQSSEDEIIQLAQAVIAYEKNPTKTVEPTPSSGIQ